MSVDGRAPPVDDWAVRLGGSTTIGAALLAAVLACSPAFAKPGKLVDKGTDNGFPIAYARGFVKHPRALIVRVRAEPGRQVEVLWQVTCRTDGKKAKVPSGEFQLTPTATRKLKMGGKRARPDDCTVDVQAAYVTASVEGFIKIELFARKRR